MKRPPLARQERDLIRVEKLIELYEPFILHNEQVFEAENVQLLAASLLEEERRAFGYDPSLIDWWDYWINIHIPALRRWCYPLIEGRAPEARPRRVGSAPATRLRSPTRCERERGLGRGPVLIHGHFPDRFDRLHRRTCRRAAA